MLFLLTNDYLYNNSVYAIQLSTSTIIKWTKYLNIDDNTISDYDGNKSNLLSFQVKPYSFIGAMIRIQEDMYSNNGYLIRIGLNSFKIDETVKINYWSAFQIKDIERSYAFIKSLDKYYLYIWNSKTGELLKKIDLYNEQDTNENNPFLAIKLRNIIGMTQYDSIDTDDVLIYDSNIISFNTLNIYGFLNIYNEFFGNKIFFLLNSDTMTFIGFDCYIHELALNNDLKIYRWININDYNTINQQNIKLMIGGYRQSTKGFITDKIKKISIKIQHLCNTKFIEKQIAKQESLIAIKWFLHSLLVAIVGIVLIGILYFMLFHQIKHPKRQ